MADLDLTMAVKVSSPELRRLTEDLQKMGLLKPFDGMRQGARGLGDEMDRMGKVAKFAQRVFEGYLLYRGFTFLKNQVVDFTRSLVDMEHQLGLVQAQLGRVGFDARPMVGQAVFGVGQATGREFLEIAKTQTQIISANIELADSFDILNLSAKAAVAGGLTDMQLAFDAALSQINAFNLPVSEFNEVFDKQFNLVRRGVFTYTQFATVVGTVSESFASMGQDIDTANASLAAISQIFTGPQLERGATGLRNAVLRLGEASEDFEALGIAVTDTSGDFRNFIDVGRDLDAVLQGMTESERFATIRGLFPDERERRGMEAFLDQLDQAEEFLVEQRYAVGDLDAAFHSVNESTLQQARILRDSLIPALEPTIGLFGAFFTGVNSANKLLPGFTANIVQLAIAYGALAAAQRLGPGMVTPFQGPALAGQGRVTGPMGLRGIPTGLGVGLGVAGLGLAAANGARPGFQAADLLGSAGTGALVGATMGGAPGAAIGALAGSLAFAIGTAFEQKAPDIGVSFADAFAEALKQRSGDVGAALSEALSKATFGIASAERIAQFEALAARGLVSVPKTALGPGSETRTGILSPYEVSIGAQPSGPMASDTTTAMASILQAAFSRAGAAREQTLERAPELSLFARSRGLDEGQLIQQAIDIAVKDAILEAFGGQESIGSLLAERLFALPAGQQAGGISAVLGALPQGLAAADRALRSIEDPVADVSAAINAFTGDAELAATVFESIGGEGAKLAKQFREVSRVMGAMEMFKTFSEMKVGGQGFFEWLGVDAAAIEGAISGEMASLLAGPEGIVSERALIDFFLHPLEEAGDALDAFAARIRRNTLEMEEIQKRAAVQGRPLTAEEIDRIKRLDLANTITEQQSLAAQMTASGQGAYGPIYDAGTGTLPNGQTATTTTGGGSVANFNAMQTFLPLVPIEQPTSMGDLDWAVRRMGGDPSMLNSMSPGGTMARLLMQKLYGGGRFRVGDIDLDTVREHDSVTGGERMNVAGSQARLYEVLAGLLQTSRRSAERGGINLYFNGPTVPSELDMSVQEIRRIAPLLVRSRSRSR